ncbi:MAG: alpha/beta hydrolase [Actinomycetota bacterium]|nr:alpha/beta hydrolase [Actinomycetota bacterium]
MSNISMERRGSGAPVALLHGIGGRWQGFEPILDVLAAQHEVIAIDLPGFGASPLWPGIVPGPRGYAAWLKTWLAGEGIDRPHIVGSSMGGAVGLELGRAGVAASVTAFSPIGFWNAAGVRWTQGMLTTMRGAGTYAGAVVDRALGAKPGRGALLAPLFGHPTRVDPDAARGDVAALCAARAFVHARSSFTDYALRASDDLGVLVEVPVTIGWGTRDVITTWRTQSARARAVLPFARHVDLPGCGHLPFNDDPELCARVVLETVAQAQEKR